MHDNSRLLTPVSGLLTKGYILFIIPFMLLSCGQDEAPGDPRVAELKRIDSLENVLLSDPSVSPALGMEMIKGYRNFATLFPDDSLAPEYLFRAGEVAFGIQNAEMAYSAFQQLHVHYPSHEKAKLALFSQAFVCESLMKDTARAKVIYKEVIQKYPEDHLAGQAKACIANLGKSPEELVREWEKKEAKK